jgi:hypothetical protein
MEMRTLTLLAHDKSKGDVLETYAMTTTDQSAVNNAIWNLRSKVAKHIQLTGRSKYRKTP